MIWEEFPNYCGGRILKGLWTKETLGYDHWSDDKLAKTIIDNHESIVPGYFAKATGNECIPDSLLIFQQILKHFCKGDNHALIFAITNSEEQGLAEEYLEATGFEKQGTYAKLGGENCVLWLGDYQNKIKNILEKVPPYGEVEVLPEKKPTFATRVPDATPTRTLRPVTSTQQTLRLRAATNTLRRSS